MISVKNSLHRTETPCLSAETCRSMFNDFLSTTYLWRLKFVTLQWTARYANSRLAAKLERQAIEVVDFRPSVITFLWPYEVS